MSAKPTRLTSCLALLFLAVACRSEKLPEIELIVKNKTVKTEVARTEAEKQKGLMERRALGDDEGMIFVYIRDERLYFWMKNTYLPLSVAFISAEGVILQIEDMRPMNEKTIESRFSVRYALEVNQGAFARWGVGVGDKVFFPPHFPEYTP